MTANISELRRQQMQWEDGFRKRFPNHPALALADGVLKLTADQSKYLEERYVPYSEEQGRLIGKARKLANARTGKDFSGLITMTTNAALRAVPDNWSSSSIFRLCNLIDAALWGVLGQEGLSPQEYAQLTGAIAEIIPDITQANGLPEKEEVVTVAAPEGVIKGIPEEAIKQGPPPGLEKNEFMAEAQRWAERNPELYAEFQRSKMGYVGGAFSYTCEKVIAEAGATEQVGRGQRALAAFYVFATAIHANAAAAQVPSVFKGREKAKAFFDGKKVAAPE